MAREGQKIKPPLKYPAGAQEVLQARPASRARRCRRCGGRSRPTTTFRARIAAGALPELVDPIGRAWLTRDEGWEAEVERLVAEADAEAAESNAAAALQRAEKRLIAAEQAAARGTGRDAVAPGARRPSAMS